MLAILFALILNENQTSVVQVWKTPQTLVLVAGIP